MDEWEPLDQNPTTPISSCAYEQIYFRQLWARNGVINLIELENDFFLSKLSCKEDYDFALVNS